MKSLENNSVIPYFLVDSGFSSNDLVHSVLMVPLASVSTFMSFPSFQELFDDKHLDFTWSIKGSFDAN